MEWSAADVSKPSVVTPAPVVVIYIASTALSDTPDP
jgi:hypothetical protein